MTRVKLYVQSILIPLGLGILVSLLLKESFNYDELIKPSIAPPSILFPIVWTIMYTLMGISYAILEEKGLNTTKVRKIYYGQLLMNLIWPIVFFGLQLRGVALMIIAVLVYLVLLMIKIFYHRNQLAGLLQIPYLLWLLFATYLNYQAYILNR
jgi:tryptophan-rich sensory protein